MPEPPVLCEDWSSHIFADPKSHIAGVAKQREPKPATMYEAATVERVDAVENPSTLGIITAKDESPYLQ